MMRLVVSIITNGRQKEKRGRERIDRRRQIGYNRKAENGV